LSRAEDLLEETITLTKGLIEGAGDDGVKARAAQLVGTLEAERGKFFYKALLGAPSANRCKRAAQAVAAAAESGDASAVEPAMAKLEAEVQDMVGKSDSPPVVLT